MISRTQKLDDILQVMDPYLDKIKGFHPEEWLNNQDNVALINDKGDLSLFERMLPSIVIGHYFYHSRGKDAVKTAKDMLREIFTGPYNVEIIQGLSPLEKLGARWLNRKLGFKAYGAIDTIAGPCEVVIMTKDEWRTLYE